MVKYMGIKDLVENYGIDNIEFYHPARPIGVGWDDFYGRNGRKDLTPKNVKLFKLDESIYKVSDGYKIILVPEEKGFYSEEYYQMDFESISREEHSQDLIYVKVNGYPYHFKFDEELPEFSLKM